MIFKQNTPDTLGDSKQSELINAVTWLRVQRVTGGINGAASSIYIQHPEATRLPVHHSDEPAVRPETPDTITTPEQIAQIITSDGFVMNPELVQRKSVGGEASSFIMGAVEAERQQIEELSRVASRIAGGQ